MNCPSCNHPNPPATKFCGECGARLPAAPPRDVPTGESRRIVTVLFADVSGFTKMSESLDPEEVKEVIDALFTRLTRVIEAQGGWVDKIMGDAIMAVFGVPRVHEDDPIRAVRAAWEMQAEIGRFAEGSRREGPPLWMRIGVNTGEVIAGPIAGREHEYSVLGDAVNTAQRLETAARPGAILVGRSTERLCREAFVLRELPAIQVKGKSEFVQPYEVVRPAAAHAKPWGRGGFVQKLVGREKEFAAVVGALQRAMDRSHVELATVWGDAGIGKSRVIYEFRSYIVDHSRMFDMSDCRCTSLSSGPYAPFAGLVRDKCGISAEDDATTARDNLLAKVRERWTTQDGDESEDPGASEITAAAHLIAHLLGMSFPAGTQRHLRPEEIRLNGFHAVRKFLFARASSERPMVLIFEDIHWADPGTLDLIAHLASAGDAAPVLLLCTARPEVFDNRPDWSRAGKVHSLVKLDPLDESAGKELVCRFLKGAAVAPEILDAVASRSGGNPLYVEEVIRALVEQGSIEKVSETGGAAWRSVGPLDTAQVPQSAQRVIAARIDRLPAREKEILQTAAVAGPSFQPAHLAVLCDTWSEAEISERLAALQQREMMEEFPLPGPAMGVSWRFRHDLIREVAYAGLPRKARRGRHARLARWMDETHANRGPELLSSIAHHYEQAGIGAKARENYHESGLAAWHMGATGTARRNFEKVLELSAEDEGWQIEATIRLATVDQLVGDCAAGIRRLRGILDVGRRWGRAAEVLAVEAILHEKTGAWAQGRACVEEGLRCPGLSAERQADLRIALGGIEFRMGKLEAASRLNHEALHLVPPEDAARRAKVANALGAVEGARGNHPRAAEHFVEAAAEAERANDKGKHATALYNLAITKRLLGGTEEALSLVRRSAEIRREIGDRAGMAKCLLELANICKDEGRLEEAARHARDSASGFESIDDRRSGSRARITLGKALQGLGDLGGAGTHLQRAYELANEMRDPQAMISAFLGLGLLHLAQEHHEVAAGHLLTARYTCLELGLTSDLFSVLTALIRTHTAWGDQISARRFLEEARAYARGHEREDWQQECDVLAKAVRA